MASENITLYIKGDRNVEVTEQDVFLKDIKNFCRNFRQ